MFNNKDSQPKFAAARLKDLVSSTDAKGRTGIEARISVVGNDEEATAHLVSRLEAGARFLGGDVEVVEEGGNRSRKGDTAKSHAISNWENSNWQPSGSAWKKN